LRRERRRPKARARKRSGPSRARLVSIAMCVPARASPEARQTRLERREPEVSRTFVHAGDRCTVSTLPSPVARLPGFRAICSGKGGPWQDQRTLARRMAFTQRFPWPKIPVHQRFESSPSTFRTTRIA
jgi:hypothetical protein